jgi:parallel beta-helix repeat protein
MSISEVDFSGQTEIWTAPQDSTSADILRIYCKDILSHDAGTIELNYIPYQDITVAGKSTTIWELYYDNNNRYDLILTENGYPKFSIVTNGTEYSITGNSPVETGTVYNFLTGWDGTHMRLCVNGVQIGNDTDYTKPAFTIAWNSYLDMGNSRYSSDYGKADGVLGDLRISNALRTLSEHQAYCSGSAKQVADEYTTFLSSLGSDYDSNITSYYNESIIVNQDPDNGNENISVLSLRIDGNYSVNGMDFTGIMLSNASKSNIAYCNVTGTGDDGIRVDFGDTCTITNNYAGYCDSGDGIVIKAGEDCIISGNICEFNEGSGISIRYDSYFFPSLYSSKCVAIGNVCRNNDAYGIAISYGTDNIVSSNTCNNNNSSGIYGGHMDHGSIIGNICKLNGEHGIYIFATNHAAINSNEVKENSQSTDLAYDGIRISGSTYNNVQDNTVRYASTALRQKYGINISSTSCDYNTVANNDLNLAGATGNFNNAGDYTDILGGNAGV